MKTALLTGGTGGLGLATARYLVEQGWQVYAADNNREALAKLEDEQGIKPLFMDVTDRQSVGQAYQQVAEEIDRLDGIVNFAGILRIGSMAEMDEAQLQLLLNINVLGTFRVNQEFLPLINSGKGKGRIVNISSETGWQSGGPFNGAYAMSKHAIEGYSDSLRRELMFLNIPVIKVQPGPFKTDMVASIDSNFTQAADHSQFFSRHLTRIKELAIKEQDKAHSPRLLASVVHTALTAAKPKAAYSVKPDPARCLLEYFPVRWADALLRAVIGK